MLQVVYSVDRGFAMPLAASLRSLQISNACDALAVTILTLDFDAELTDRVRRSAPELTLDFIDVGEVVPHGLPRIKAFSRATYGRIFAADFLESDCDRLLYIDADTLVLDRVSPLRDFHLTGLSLAAVQSVGLPFISAAGGVPHWAELGISRDAAYFNAGVLLIDRSRWIDQQIAKLTVEAAHRYADSNLWADQDPLNMIFAGEFARLPSRWNAESALRRPVHLGHAIFEPLEVKEAQESPAIIHFTGAPKPWHAGSEDPARGLWWDYIRRTEWRELSPQRRLPWHRELKHRVGLALRG